MVQGHFIKAQGRDFVYEGRKIRLRGFGIGTWMNLEHFMIGIPTPDSMIQEAFGEVFGDKQKNLFFEEYRNAFFGEEDFRLLKECGVNFIRVPFHYHLFFDDSRPEVWKEEGFCCFDRLFALGRKYEIFIMPDLHAVPGSQNPDWHSDNRSGIPLFWKYRVFRQQITRLWKAIAKRYSEEPSLMGYDLLNEPAMANWDAVNEFYRETIEAIRSVDQNHTIVLEGDLFSMDFSGLENFGDENTALGFHYYPTVWNIDLLSQGLYRKIRKQKIAEGFDRLLKIRDTFNCPAICGEFGYGADCGEKEFTQELLSDTLDIMEERKADWCLWCYKDAHFMSLVSPCSDGKWMTFAEGMAKRWDQDIEKAQAAELLEMAGRKFFPEITEEDKYELQFRVRACLFYLQKKYIVKPALKAIQPEEVFSYAREFLFENCEVDEEMKKIVRQILKIDSSI